MTKYTKQALKQLVLMLVTSGATALMLGFSAAYFGIANVIFALAIAVFFICSYKFVKIQAEINERIDKLNNK